RWGSCCGCWRQAPSARPCRSSPPSTTSSPRTRGGQAPRDGPDARRAGSGGTTGIFPMCWPGSRSEAEDMNTNTVNPEAAHRYQPPFGSGPERPALRRPVQGRMLAGVAAGLARYFGIDETLVRIAFVVLTVAGGVGLPLYLAGLLLIPEEGSEVSLAGFFLQPRPR